MSKIDTFVTNIPEFRRMKKYLFFLVFHLFFLENGLNAQSVADITRQITEGKTMDSAKAAAIYDWLTQNIRYDHRHRYRDAAQIAAKTARCAQRWQRSGRGKL